LFFFVLPSLFFFPFMHFLQHCFDLLHFLPLSKQATVDSAVGLAVVRLVVGLPVVAAVGLEVGAAMGEAEGAATELLEGAAI
jgi:hypothetical protein